MKKLSEMMRPVPLNSGFRMEGYWTWDGSVIKGDDGKYHMFASRWPKTLPMHPGWLIKSEIVHAVCDTPYGEFKFSDVVFSARGPEYWDGRITHNPQVIKIGDIYVIYYTGSRYIWDCKDEEVTLDHPSVIMARSQKRVGIAYSKSLYGPWIRSDRPLLDTRPGYADSYLTSNPVACLDKDGSIFMAYKGRGYVDTQKNPYRFGQMKLLCAKGKDAFSLSRSDDNLLFSNLEGEMEDPFIWYNEGYHLIAKDMNGAICGLKFGGVHAFSKDGEAWEIDKEPFFERKLLYENGEIRNMGNMERPCILFEDGRPICAYFSTSNGSFNGGFMDCTDTWVVAIPLES
ncbi:MAG: glycoside hydrolase family protein [Clostridia bacterium]|nr:glycoside hydrolase family protein [Clostridia bacterium]